MTTNLTEAGTRRRMSPAARALLARVEARRARERAAGITHAGPSATQVAELAELMKPGRGRAERPDG
ncbi:hypothetical protein L5G28_07485 [Gordonia sp. HY285]|uniref:hypothetical protein n=1 Tax=Gordonia liuliyuniae TaxID=2911517 RepID=UPI001F23A4CA|nr:hypothetical protein [Gordonia liuliyuniae]MCF8610002.1 hypothetical protein [Gordonia liuliyuniae]